MGSSFTNNKHPPISTSSSTAHFVVFSPPGALSNSETGADLVFVLFLVCSWRFGTHQAMLKTSGWDGTRMAAHAERGAGSTACARTPPATRVVYAAIRCPALRSTPRDQTCRLPRGSEGLTLLTVNHEPSTYPLPFALAIGSHALLQNYQGDVRKLAQLNFDAVKFDGKPAVRSAHCTACSLQLVAHRRSGVHTA